VGGEGNRAQALLLSLVWGADWYPDTGEVGFEALINIRPRQQNYGIGDD